MHPFTITKDELDRSLQFFRENSIEVLTDVAHTINIQQPVFTRLILSFEHGGLDVDIMEDLMESILTVYYVHSHLRKQVIPEITLEEVMGNLGGYAKSLQKFRESGRDTQDDLTAHAYLEDRVVLNYACQLLVKSFPDVRDIPKEVTYGYFALLKSIELAVAKVYSVG
jgi:hypothetical protein